MTLASTLNTHNNATNLVHINSGVVKRISDEPKEFTGRQVIFTRGLIPRMSTSEAVPRGQNELLRASRANSVNGSLLKYEQLA